MCWRIALSMPLRANFRRCPRAFGRSLPQYQFEIRAANYQTLFRDIQEHRVDFILTNPSNYLHIRAHAELTAPLATWTSGLHPELRQFGGVIVVRSARLELQGLHDLEGRQVAGAEPSSMGGFQSQAYELLKCGLLFNVDYRVRFVGLPHDQIVRQVLEGSVDAGFIRTGVIEQLIQSGQVRPGDLRVLRSTDAPGPAAFPLLVSTPLYPEWPLVAHARTDEGLIRQVVQAALSPQFSTHSGEGSFSVPSRYDEVEAMVRALRLSPFDHGPDFTLRDVWRRYTWQSGMLTLMWLAVTVLSIWLIWTNHRLKHKRQLLQREIRQRQALLETMNEGVYELDTQGRCVEINSAALQMLGYARGELIGAEVHELIHHRQENGQYHAPQDCQMLRTIRDGRPRSHDDWFTRKDGVGFPVAVRVSAHPGTHAPHAVVVVFHDITERHRREREIHHLAYHDALTGLPNRTLFADRLEQGLALSRRVGDRIALIFVDLDRFKAVNDAHGHQAGDRLLIQVAIRLRECLRASDTAARVGGDEFIVLLHGIRDAEDAQAVAQKIRAHLQEPYDLGEGLIVNSSASLGVVIDPPNGLDAAALNHHADQAMYRSKQRGGNRVTVIQDLEPAGPETQAGGL